MSQNEKDVSSSQLQMPFHLSFTPFLTRIEIILIYLIVHKNQGLCIEVNSEEKITLERDQDSK